MNNVTKENTKLSDRIKELRNEKQISLKTLGEDIDIHQNSLWLYEHNTYPSIENLCKIKKYYNVSYDYLFGENDIKNYDNIIENIEKDRKKNIKMGTGLSEKAIDILYVLNKDKSNYLNTISFLIENLADDSSIIELINNYLNSSTTNEKTYLNQIIDKLCETKKKDNT